VGVFSIFGPANKRRRFAAFAHVAQLAEHILGKDEVTSSNLVMGSRFGVHERAID
jgi:hypothetical protein